MPIRLKIGKSRFVPTAVEAKVEGIQHLTPLYIWRSSGMSTGDWKETKSRLGALSSALSSAVAASDDREALAACKEILTWGGNRDLQKGAYPFLISTNSDIGLCKYLSTTRDAFRLSVAHLDSLLCVKLMNAMLTKVHALLADDGLPIYDSRVAAAIGALVEMWRRSVEPDTSSVPQPLIFPATLSTRTVLRLFPTAPHPKVIVYNHADTPRIWSSAKVRLGWLMEMILPGFISASPAMTMHDFEAALFMIGYDIACLTDQAVETAATLHESEQAVKNLLEQTATIGSQGFPLETLSHDGKQIFISAREDRGYDVEWGTLRFALEGAALEDIELEFSGRASVPLGASVDGNVAPESLGQWLIENGWPSRRYASAIAPILVHLQIVKNVTRPRGFVLEF
jgi:hypothetical protein